MRFGLAGGIVGIAAFVLAAGLAAAFAAVALPVVLVSEADQVDAAAVIASKRLSDHEKHDNSAPNNLIWDTTQQLNLGHYRIKNSSRYVSQCSESIFVMPPI